MNKLVTTTTSIIFLLILTPFVLSVNCNYPPDYYCYSDDLTITNNPTPKFRGTFEPSTNNPNPVANMNKITKQDGTSEVSGSQFTFTKHSETLTSVSWDVTYNIELPTGRYRFDMYVRQEESYIPENQRNVWNKYLDFIIDRTPPTIKPIYGATGYFFDESGTEKNRFSPGETVVIKAKVQDFDGGSTDLIPGTTVQAVKLIVGSNEYPMEDKGTYYEKTLDLSFGAHTVNITAYDTLFDGIHGNINEDIDLILKVGDMDGDNSFVPNDCDDDITNDPSPCPTNLATYNPSDVDCSKSENSKCAKCIHPGADDICANGIDENCDNEDASCDCENNDGDTQYAIDKILCPKPYGIDCDDDNANIYLGAPEICNNGIDEDCNKIDDPCPGCLPNEHNNDGDLYCTPADCDDRPYGANGIPGDADDGANINPRAPEICEDGIDNDCVGGDATCTCEIRNKIDGDGDNYCLDDGDNTDCNDNEPIINPGADEVCNGVDDDCDPNNSYPGESDNDGDGYLACSDEPSKDCNDYDEDMFPGNPEICDGIDNDCDGTPLPEEVDSDGDTYLDCEDCKPNDASTHPEAPELCNGLDDDCNGIIPPNEIDNDGDGFAECEGDCNDNDININPDAIELCNEDIDDDCNPDTDENTDEDGDGLSSCEGDCDDTDDKVKPGAEEICDKKDSNCDGYTPPEELDIDEDGVALCQGDCDDNDPVRYPGAIDYCGNNIDEDCDWSDTCNCVDNDGDNFPGHNAITCSYGTDCDDTNPAISPAAPEICGNPIDEDCDYNITVCIDCHPFEDKDKDLSCSDVDCEDRIDGEDGIPNTPDDGAYFHPEAFELCNSEEDYNCDGEYGICECMSEKGLPDEDSDGFCFGDTINPDCNDNDAAINPDADEVCNSVDDNCDGYTDEGCPELECNGIDDDGDGEVDEGFQDFDNDKIGCDYTASPLNCGADCVDNDIDGDTVPNLPDQDDFTPLGCIVNRNTGIHIESTDNDGVCDGLDLCNDTLPGCPVDEQGCPIQCDAEGNEGACVGDPGCPCTTCGLCNNVYGWICNVDECNACGDCYLLIPSEEGRYQCTSCTNLNSCEQYDFEEDCESNPCKDQIQHDCSWIGNKCYNDADQDEIPDEEDPCPDSELNDQDKDKYCEGARFNILEGTQVIGSNDCKDSIQDDPAGCPQIVNSCAYETAMCAICIHPGATEICNNQYDEDCQNGPLICEDDNICTDNTCDLITETCNFVNNNIECDDNIFCTIDDVCNGGTCSGTLIDCDDGKDCTLDTCDEDTSTCTHDTTGCECDVDIDCNDGDVCTDNTCSEDGYCDSPTDNTAQCNDYDVCTLDDQCSNGVCQGIPNTCNDYDDCTDDSCDSSTRACINTFTCECHNDQECSDGDICTDDSCTAGTCVYINNNAGCDDNNECTQNDQCNDGQCLGTHIVCDDERLCTVDNCNPAIGCIYSTEGCICNSDSECDDGNTCTDNTCNQLIEKCDQAYNTEPCNDDYYCTVDDVCNEGQCIGTGNTCDDGNDCTMDECDEDTQGCTNEYICPCATDADCDDNDVCTDDACIDGYCEYTLNTVPCDDKNWCIVNDLCSEGVCQGTQRNCEDNRGCTDDECEEDVDRCVHETIDCDCSSDTECEDFNPCTDNTCNQLTDKCNPPTNNNALCEDGLFCTVGDICDEGICSGIQIDCDDNLFCTSDSCSEDLDMCIYGYICPCSTDGECEDNNPCTDEECTDQTCHYTKHPDCDKDNICNELDPDDDNDGVLDGDDNEDCTPIGCDVNPNYGTYLDYDNDGVCDGLDLCDNTLSGCPVNEQGCPEQCDGDINPKCIGDPGCPCTTCGLCNFIYGWICNVDECSACGTCYLSDPPEGRYQCTSCNNLNSCEQYDFEEDCESNPCKDQIQHDCSWIDESCHGDNDKDNIPNNLDSCPDDESNDNDGDDYCQGPTYQLDKIGSNDCDDSNAAINPGEEEDCTDDIDNNCNNDLEDGCECYPIGAEEECGTDVGECQKGMKTCQSDGWSECQGSISPIDEICDGKDNDCDSSIDNGCPCEEGEERSCGTNEGECVSGTQYCDIYGRLGECQGSIGPQPDGPDINCDNLDNDCDGNTDKGCFCPEETTTQCGTDVGECSSGTQYCDPYSGWGECIGAIEPQQDGPDINCDSLDNDCDGSTDEDCPCEQGETIQCGTNVGACEFGLQICNIYGKIGECEGGIQPIDEICHNNIDDDCDGIIDEICPELECDGIDNDGDGEVDEGFPDYDEDGIADCVDNDKDGDSVPNKYDQEPFTSLGCAVNLQTGIGLDFDNDEVCNTFDECEDTLTTCPVKEDGCPETCEDLGCIGDPSCICPNCGDCFGSYDSYLCSIDQCATCGQGKCYLNYNWPGRDACESCTNLNSCEQYDFEENCIANPCEYKIQHTCSWIDNKCEDDTDQDNIPDSEDPCPHDSLNDNDNDGYCQGISYNIALDKIGGNDCDESNADINPGKTELCDYIDNNCDGSEDEGCPCTEGESRECGTDVGECSQGTQYCDIRGRWSECQGSVGPQSDGVGVSCDGLDNDCDGTIDNECPCAQGDQKSCGSDVGECSTGTQYCNIKGDWSECQGSVGPQQDGPNINCDGLDNNCDETIDNECPCAQGDQMTCGSDTGECSQGTQYCNIKGKWEECQGSISPTDEICDGLDNNCNSEIDEDCPCKPVGIEEECGTNIGECQKGIRICQPTGWSECQGSIEPQQDGPDINCDDLDNDCDGTIDESCPELECNGLDDDNDGETDEGFPDFDNDGIADCVDNEKDGDSVPDDYDQEEWTILGCEVNLQTGEGLDNDNDGVCNTYDNCENTLTTCPVNEQGCPQTCKNLGCIGDPGCVCPNCGDCFNAYTTWTCSLEQCAACGQGECYLKHNWPGRDTCKDCTSITSCGQYDFEENCINNPCKDTINTDCGWIEEECVEVDITPPEPPVLDDLPLYVGTQFIDVNGTSEPGSTVYILLDESYTGKSAVAEEGFFEAENIELQLGINSITAVAMDAAGNIGEMSDAKQIVYVIQAPTLLTIEPGDTEVKNNVQDITTAFTLYDIPINFDNSNIEVENEYGYLINGILEDNDLNEITFTPPNEFDDGIYYVTITVEDILGNQNVYETIFTVLSQAPLIELESPKDGDMFASISVEFKGTIESTVAGADIISSVLEINNIEHPLSLGDDGSFSKVVDLAQDGVYSFIITAENELGYVALETGTITIDTIKPEVCIEIDEVVGCSYD